jgi:hypothetical protein
MLEYCTSCGKTLTSNDHFMGFCNHCADTTSATVDPVCGCCSKKLTPAEISYGAGKCFPCMKGNCELCNTETP